MQRIYFDHNATTPIHPVVADAMAAALREEFGNPSSVHYFGQRAKAVIDRARSALAALIGADPSELVFTSGGTESDNVAIRGIADALERSGRRHLVASAIEHEAILNTLKALARRGFDTTLLSVGETGIVSPDDLRAALRDDTALVSVMHANNEIGTIQPIAELAQVAHERGTLFHTDAVQTAGKIPINVHALGVDLLSISPGGASRSVGSISPNPSPPKSPGSTRRSCGATSAMKTMCEKPVKASTRSSTRPP